MVHIIRNMFCLACLKGGRHDRRHLCPLFLRQPAGEIHRRPDPRIPAYAEKIGYVIDENRFFQIGPLKAPFVVEAFKRYAEGATMKGIMNWLNSQGLTTNRNQKFTYNSSRPC